MTDQPAGPPRQAKAPPPRQGRPVELLPGDLKTRAPEQVRTARPQMHPIQRRPVASPLGDVDTATGATSSSSPAQRHNDTE